MSRANSSRIVSARLLSSRKALAVAVLLVGAGPVGAATLVSYDFEGVTGSDSLAGTILNGQDTWAIANTDNPDAVVRYNVPGLDGTNVVCNPASVDVNSNVIGAGDVRSQRSISPLSFTNADTAVEQRAYVMVDDLNRAVTPDLMPGSTIGLRFAGVNTAFMLFGFDAGTPYFRAGTGTEYHGAASVIRRDWYEFKGVMDFSQAGGLMTLSYRDLTAGETAFTTEAGLTNLNMSLTPSGGVYTADGIDFRIGCGPQQGIGYADNFSVSTVPEPAGLSLLALGALGLRSRRHRKLQA